MAMQLVANRVRKTASVFFPSNATPSNQPPSEQTPTPPVPESILAFRTITTMLSYLHRARDEYKEEPAIQNKVDKERLRLLSALTILMVREHEVVAAVSKEQSVANSTEVVISAHSEQCEEGLPLSKPNNVYDQFRSMWFYATANPRQQKGPSTDGDSLTPGPEITQPVIINPEDKVPADLLEARNNDDLYQIYVEKYLWASFNCCWLMALLRT